MSGAAPVAASPNPAIADRGWWKRTDSGTPLQDAVQKIGRLKMPAVGKGSTGQEWRELRQMLSSHGQRVFAPRGKGRAIDEAAEELGFSSEEALYDALDKEARSGTRQSEYLDPDDSEAMQAAYMKHVKDTSSSKRRGGIAPGSIAHRVTVYEGPDDPKTWKRSALSESKREGVRLNPRKNVRAIMLSNPDAMKALEAAGKVRDAARVAASKAQAELVKVWDAIDRERGAGLAPLRYSGGKLRVHNRSEARARAAVAKAVDAKDRADRAWVEAWKAAGSPLGPMKRNPARSSSRRKPSSRKNPPSLAREVKEGERARAKWAGRKPDRYDMLSLSPALSRRWSVPRVLTVLGEARSMKLRGAGRVKFVPGSRLISDPSGAGLLLVSGTQAPVPERAAVAGKVGLPGELARKGWKLPADLRVLGELESIIYRERKSWDDDKTADYEHHFGPGAQVLADRRGPLLAVAGGGFDVRPEGIVG